MYRADDLFTPERLDALICAAAQLLDLPMLTRDAAICESGEVRVVW